MLCPARRGGSLPSTVTVDDVLPTPLFEEVRPRLQPLVSELRSARRQRLEPHCTVTFENRETVLWQIQEVLRVEARIGREHVAAEIEQYDALLPRPGELRATVFVDSGRLEEAARLSECLVSNPRALELRVGDVSCHAECVDERPSTSSPVHYVRFPVYDAGIHPLALANRRVELVTTRARRPPQVLGASICQALASDLWINGLVTR